MSHIDQRVQYTVTVQGRVDRSLADWFGPLDVAVVERDGQAVTVLSGLATDQAGVVGLIRHLHSLGVTLLSVERAPRAEPHPA